MVGICMLITFPLFGQFTNARSSSAGNDHVGNAITGDRGRNTYVTGQFDGSIDFINFSSTTVLTPVFSFPAAYVARIRRTGTLAWAALIESDQGPAEGLDIAYHESTQQVFVTGYFEGVLQITDGQGNMTVTNGQAGEDMFAASFSMNGTLQNIMLGLGNGNDRGRGIAIDRLSNKLSIVGSYDDKIDFFHLPAMGSPGPSLGNVVTQINTPQPDLDGFSIASDVSLSAVSGATWIEGPGDDICYATSFDGQSDIHYVGAYETGATIWESSSGSQMNSLTGTGGRNGILVFMNTAGAYGWDAQQRNTGTMENFDIVTISEPMADFDGFSFVTGYYTSDLGLYDLTGVPNLSTLSVPHNCPTVVNQMDIFGYDNNGVPLWASYVESCNGGTAADEGAIGHGLSFEWTNSDILYVAGQVDDSSNFFWVDTFPPYIPMPIPIPYAGGGPSDDVDAVLLKIIATQLPYNPSPPPASVSLANGTIYAYNSSTTSDDPDISFEVFANLNCDVFPTGSFTSLAADFNPIAMNPGTCGGAPCPPKMYWANVFGCSFKTLPPTGDVATELEETTLFSIAPNPSSGKLTILSEDPAPAGARLTVSNINGQVVFTAPLPEGAKEFHYNLNDLPAGLYVLSLEGSVESTRRVKWIKQ